MFTCLQISHDGGLNKAVKRNTRVKYNADGVNVTLFDIDCAGFVASDKPSSLSGVDVTFQLSTPQGLFFLAMPIGPKQGH